jgi:ADP-ribose pyrophosphatase YjhB (NUDIX family)
LKRDYPERPIVGVGALVWKGDHILLIRRGNPPRRGEWSLPGGAQDLGETVFEAARREVREEAGIEIRVTELVDVIDFIDRDPQNTLRYHYTLIDVLADYISGEATPGHDADAASWFTREEALMKVNWAETRRVIAKSFAMRQNARTQPS